MELESTLNKALRDSDPARCEEGLTSLLHEVNLAHITHTDDTAADNSHPAGSNMNPNHPGGDYNIQSVISFLPTRQLQQALSQVLRSHILPVLQTAVNTREISNLETNLFKIEKYTNDYEMKFENERIVFAAQNCLQALALEKTVQIILQKSGKIIGFQTKFQVLATDLKEDSDPSLVAEKTAQTDLEAAETEIEREILQIDSFFDKLNGLTAAGLDEFMDEFGSVHTCVKRVRSLINLIISW